MAVVAQLESTCTIPKTVKRALTWQTIDTVLYLYTFVRVTRRAGLEVALKVCDAILVRVDEVTVQSAELRRYDLEEVVEHVLRFRRLQNRLSLSASATDRQTYTQTKIERTLAVLPSSGFW